MRPRVYRYASRSLSTCSNRSERASLLETEFACRCASLARTGRAPLEESDAQHDNEKRAGSPTGGCTAGRLPPRSVRGPRRKHVAPSAGETKGQRHATRRARETREVTRDLSPLV